MSLPPFPTGCDVCRGTITPDCQDIGCPHRARRSKERVVTPLAVIVVVIFIVLLLRATGRLP